MMKGTRDAVLKRIQPISIHGQMSWEIVFTHADDPGEQLNAARVGPEAIVGHTLEAGDKIQVEYPRRRRRQGHAPPRLARFCGSA